MHINEWERSDTFHTFDQYVDPYFEVTVHIDVTNAFEIARRLTTSFQLFYFHKALLAANQTDCFKTRLLDSHIYKFEEINAVTPVIKGQHIFGDALLPYKAAYPAFAHFSNQALQQVFNGEVSYRPEQLNVIRFNTIPWLSFQHIKFPTFSKDQPYTPTIHFGKIMQKNTALPMHIKVHQGLISPLEVGLFIDRFQDLLYNI